ncbi:MAG: DUF669 domain-containing protein [Spartobacteria bacterium]|nr:DUF669 domain-containing protein [Spartobacteria bacterium]
MSENEAFGWDDEVEEGSGFVLLPEGPARFTVTKFERARKAMGKLGTCNVAMLTLECTSEDTGDKATVTCNLPLHRVVQFKIFQFFTAIGQRKHGDGAFVPNWAEVPGASGRCEISTREWVGKDGAKKESNDVSKFLEGPSAAGDVGDDDDELEF